MQKKIIALAVAGLVSGAAFAQTNVTVYGTLDMAYVHQSDSVTDPSGQKANAQNNIDDGGWDRVHPTSMLPRLGARKCRAPAVRLGADHRTKTAGKRLHESL